MSSVERQAGSRDRTEFWVAFEHASDTNAGMGGRMSKLKVQPCQATLAGKDRQ